MENAKKQKSMINDLTEGSVSKQLLKFAWPFVVSNFLQTVYNLVDMVIVGQYIGSAGLSAVSMGGEVLILFTFLCLGFVSAGQVMISQFVGRKEYDSVKKVIGMIFTTVFVLAIFITAISLPLAHPILKLLNVPDEAMGGAMDYTRVCLGGVIFTFGYNAVGSIMRGMGDSKRPLMFIAISATANIFLDILFVGPMNMGPGGAALATVMSQALSFIIAIIYLYRNREAFGFDFKLRSFTIHKDLLLRMIKLGVPMMLQFSAITISMMFVNAYINQYGVTYMAVTAIGNKLGNITNIVTQSLNAAGSGMIGQNIAAGKHDRVSKVVIMVTVMGLAFAALLSLLMIIMPEQLFAIFDNEEAVLAVARSYVPIAVINFFGYATRSPAMSLINGMGYASLAFFCGIMDGVVVRIGLAFLMGIVFDMGIYGFWYGMVIAGHVFGVVGAVYFLSGRWKKKKLIIS
ncbi:MAG: MATE family efflux transporter [Clostridiales bacterium]|nr:MATE family efflux transporter [Clostridiales bacterium]